MHATAPLLLLLAAACSLGAPRNTSFPQGFLFGASSAAYQVEGAWNTSGRGESNWDRLIHRHPECISNEATADVAADSYHKYQEDVRAAKEVGFDFYRFSISWPRIMPQGNLSLINQDGIDYYNNLINALLANNIQPVVTMFHWDLPQSLQDLGGLMNPAIVDYFEDYARLLYTTYGDRVKLWTTFNEPYEISVGLTSACEAPADLVSPGFGEYLAMHNLLKAHATAYRLYDREFRRRQGGKVGITLSAAWAVPKSQSAADLEAAERYLQFTVGWFAHPIFSQEGDYPSVMKERVARNSKAEGLRRSRLPEFGPEWVDYIKGSYDFFGLNHYTTKILSEPATATVSQISMANDMGNLVTEQDDAWPYGAATYFRYVPFGMRNILKWVSERYNGVDILITENGWCDSGELNDTMRTRFYVNYLAAVLDAIYLDNVQVIGHAAWSLIDNFEWASGYSMKFGLYYVDFNDPDRPRVPKDSSKVYASMIKNRSLPEEYLDKVEE
ncbi:myrosinase 1-like [Bacillus rossius redtenbacheri]|uniref:myrosinase 1-like n=1 Tax=Bacillus rossius redtenbacheri TaxID=93214 RepID=UPI002FDD9C57